MKSKELLFFFKQKTAYVLRISDWSSDVCSSDLEVADPRERQGKARQMNAGKGGVDVLGMMTLHLSDEAQGQVQVLRRDPARAGQAVAEVAQAAAQGVGQGNGNEETQDRKSTRLNYSH